MDNWRRLVGVAVSRSSGRKTWPLSSSSAPRRRKSPKQPKKHEQRSRPAPTSSSNPPSTSRQPPTARASPASPTSSFATTRARTRSTTPSSLATPRSAPCSSSPPTPTPSRRRRRRPHWRAGPPRARRPHDHHARPRRHRPGVPHAARRTRTGHRRAGERDRGTALGQPPLLQLRPPHDLPDPGAAAPRPGPGSLHAHRPADEAFCTGCGQSTTWRTAPQQCQVWRDRRRIG